MRIGCQIGRFREVGLYPTAVQMRWRLLLNFREIQPRQVNLHAAPGQKSLRASNSCPNRSRRQATDSQGRDERLKLRGIHLLRIGALEVLQQGRGCPPIGPRRAVIGRPGRRKMGDEIG